MFKVKLIVKVLFYRFFSLLPVVDNRVLFYSYYGEHYSGSPKYISEYLSVDENLSIIWAFTQPDKYTNIQNCKIIKYGSLKYYYYLATSGTIVTNYRQTKEFKRRKKQKYIQTWHSSLRLKMIEKDAEETLKPNYIKMAQSDSNEISYLISGSQKSSEIFRQSFWYDGEIVPTGTPQCDLFFDNIQVEKCKEKVRNHYNLTSKEKIILYAPTFRKDYTTDAYIKDFNELKRAFEDALNSNVVFLIRLHPHMVNLTDLIEYNDFVLQATNYDDPQELLCAADVLISDYSAIMFDYMLTKRPCFLYVTDLEKYIKNDRNLYFDINELPFVICTSFEKIINNIYNFNNAEYQKKLSDFLEQIGSFDDGKSCERIKNIIEGKCNE